MKRKSNISYFKERNENDPLERIVKTVNPDNSEQRVIFGVPNALNTPDKFTPTPWENYAYDANDLAPLTNPNSNVPSSHFYTPKSSLVDALGRTVQTTEHKAHYNATAEQYEDVVMSYRYDIQGNLLAVKDPYNRTVFEHKYDLRPPHASTGSASDGEQQPLPPLWTRHIDSGESVVLFDVTGKAIESEDAKGARVLNSYDILQRPNNIWANDKTGEVTTLRQHLLYGDNAGLLNPENHNLNGQIYKHYDEAGLVETPEYDFKGNLLTNKRQCISDTELLSVFASPPVDWKIDCYRVDWTGLPSILDAKVFETNSEYDALNRVTKMIYPEDVENERKELIPEYNRAGALQRVTMDGTDYVRHIAYNAKGQRLLIAFGNDIMTRYCYKKITFRLQRIRSEKYVKTQDGNKQIFTPQSGTAKQDSGYIDDLIGNILNINERTSNCGIGGTDSLNRAFSYDPLYRLLSANGRENNPIVTPIWDDSYRSTDNFTTTAYTQNYEYDRVGNIQKLQHIGNNNFTRNFNYSNANNKLNSIDIGMTNYAFSYDDCGNQTQETTNRHFEWDFRNNIRCFYNQISTAEPTVYAQYLYDSSGNRVKKIVRTQGSDYESVSYINGVFEYKTDGTDEQNTLHVLDDQSRIALIRLGDDFGDTTPAIKYNLEDHLGSSCILLETNGALINKEEYYPFGETSFGSYAKKRYKFSGKERDNESGLYYYGARYYMAWSCRFVSCDPLAGDFPWQSSYVGFNNNPMKFIDPSGASAEPSKNDDGFKVGKNHSEKKFERKFEKFKHNNLDIKGEGELFQAFADSRNFFGKVNKETKWFQNYISNTLGRSSSTAWTPSVYNKQSGIIIEPAKSGEMFMRKQVDLKQSNGVFEVTYDMKFHADELIIRNPKTGQEIFKTNGAVSYQEGSGQKVQFDLGRKNTVIEILVNPEYENVPPDKLTIFFINIKLLSNSSNSGINGYIPNTKGVKKQHKVKKFKLK